MSRPKMSATWTLPRGAPHPTDMTFTQLLRFIASARKEDVDKQMAREQQRKVAHPRNKKTQS